jgi:hypothetical protein
MFFVPRFQGVQGCSVPGQFSVLSGSSSCSQALCVSSGQAPSACKGSGSVVPGQPLCLCSYVPGPASMFSVPVLGSSFQGSQPLSRSRPRAQALYICSSVSQGCSLRFQGSLRSVLQAPCLQAPQAPGSSSCTGVLRPRVPSRLRLQAQGPGLCSQESQAQAQGPVPSGSRLQVPGCVPALLQEGLFSGSALFSGSRPQVSVVQLCLQALCPICSRLRLHSVLQACASSSVF